MRVHCKRTLILGSDCATCVVVFVAEELRCVLWLNCILNPHEYKYVCVTNKTYINKNIYINKIVMWKIYISLLAKEKTPIEWPPLFKWLVLLKYTSNIVLWVEGHTRGVPCAHLWLYRTKCVCIFQMLYCQNWEEKRWLRSESRKLLSTGQSLNRRTWC